MTDWLQSGANIATIIGTLIVIFGGFVVFRRYKSKQSIKGNEQKIIGSGNVQAGGDIGKQVSGGSNEAIPNSTNIKDTRNQKIINNKQTIVGDDNKQAGGNLNE